MKCDWFSVDGQRLDDWLGLCNVGEYYLRQPSELPSIISQPLKAKTTTVLMMASGNLDNEGTAYFVANIIRYDPKDNAYDQQPFALSFVAREAAGSACMVQHGNWPGRTSNNLVLPTELSGYLSDLYLDSHKHALETSITQVRGVLEDQQRWVLDPSRQPPAKSSF